MMVRAYLNVRATGGAVFFPMRGENTRERWSPFKGEGDGGCSKKKRKINFPFAFSSLIRIFAAENQKLSMTLFLSYIHVADNVAWLMTEGGSNCMVESGKNTPPSPSENSRFQRDFDLI